jgi:membrane protease YdiL (CAAX protease family)
VLLKSALAIVSSTVISIWVIDLIPLNELHIQGAWLPISYRALQTIFSLAMMKVFCPHALHRLTLRIRKKATAGIFLLVGGLSMSDFIHINWSNTSTYTISMGALFTLFIGIDEEIYSRGFVLGVLEQYGPWVAIAGSSVDFGFLHLTNYFYGGQSLDVTIAQMIGAASFGFMSAALMFYSGSIWPSILLHAFSDFQMTQETPAVYTSGLTSSPDWIGSSIESLLYILIGFLLLAVSGGIHQLRLPKSIAHRTKSIAEYLGLINLE